MPYNTRLIEYPNGEMQIRRYSIPMISKEPNPYETESKKLPDNYELNPFDNKRVRVVEDFDELLTSNVEDNERRSISRTRQMIYEYSRSVCWEWFITFTFNAEKVDRYDFDVCSKIVRQWLHNQRRNASDLQYLIVPEYHKDRAIHFHGLLANTGNMKFTDSGKRQRGVKVYNMSSWANGWTTATKVKNIHSVSKYIGKYITKELCIATKGKNRYFASNNLPKPETSTFLLSDNEFDDFLQTLKNSLGTEIMHISKPRAKGAFVDVDYYELQEVAQ